jgi:glycosyltransferase involved in cell wall biosynthesis
MTTHIVIDARLYGPKHTGLGRYTKNLLLALMDEPDFKKFKFTLLIYPELEIDIKKDLGDNYNYFKTNIRHYTFAEQLILPFVISKLHPDLVHFTHFDKPILYLGKSVVTVHDLIRHFSKGKETTTKNLFLYWPKYLGYLMMSWFILHTNYLIVPSNFWRNYILKQFKIPPEKIITTYEAVDSNLISPPTKTLSKPKNYILYTGNLYPHKNIKVIFEALQQLPGINLKIICARDLFAVRSQILANELKVKKQVEFLGYIPDSDFKKLYSQAIALIHPALLEGFSLTGLEAMALNCPVISSTSSCLPEIYQESVLYFDPYSPEDLVSKISKLYNNDQLRQSLIKKGRDQILKYSWNNTASLTLNYYLRILS